MSLRLVNRDYAASGGGLVSDTGEEALLDEVLFRLTVRRGSFPFLPELGSRMYLLRREKSSARTDLACQYAAEALSGISGLAVTGATVGWREDDLTAEISLLWQGEKLTVTAQVEE